MFMDRTRNDVLVFATWNEHKVAEVQALLGGRCDVVSLREVRFPDDLPEERATLEGNALQKARFAHRVLGGVPCFADDTGLEVAALGGEPGVRSARFAGEERDEAANTRLLLERLAGVRDRRARFRCVMALVGRGREFLFEGVVEGVILEEGRGTGGFGYDPVFLPDGFGETFGEMTAGAKNALSHRGRAAEEMVRFLDGWW
jgi:XTP/dITP diphosphohydrolase